MAKEVLETEDRNKVVKFLSNLDAFKYGPRDRVEFISAAGLGQFIAGKNWDGAPGVVAGALVDELNRHGTLQKTVHDKPEDTSYHALGKLFVYCLDYPSVGEEDAKCLATLIVEHGLVHDPIYLQNLQQKYGITKNPPPEAMAPVAAASSLPPIAPPPFTVIPALKDKQGLEMALSEQDNFLDLYLLVGALYCAQAVGRVEVPQEKAQGTGWLIGPDLLLTNWHVLPKPEYAAEGVVRFGYMQDGAGVKMAGERVIKMNPDFYYYSKDDQLDYVLVQLQEKPLAEKMLPGGVGGLSMLDLLRQDKHRGYLVVEPREIINLQAVNIIQHAAGGPLKVVLTQNLVADDATATRVHYYADTKSGSSGSPVFNKLWEVIALHHSGGPYPPEAASSRDSEDRLYQFNEGIPMKAILAEFKTVTSKKGIPLIKYIPEPK